MVTLGHLAELMLTVSIKGCMVDVSAPHSAAEIKSDLLSSEVHALPQNQKAVG